MNLKRLKDTRIDNDLTQEIVADKIKVPRTTYSSWENNHSKPPLLYLIKVCLELNVSIDYVLNLTDNPKRYYNVKDINLKIISNNITKLLNAKKINQKQLSLELSLSESRISHIIHAKEIISVKSIYYLAKKYNFSIDEFCYKNINF